MNKNDIITKLAASKTVENIISNITHNSIPQAEIDDLAQDIYVTLLEKDDTVIENLYATNAINFFITKIVKNNIFSTTSPYYKLYGKWNSKRSDLEI